MQFLFLAPELFSEVIEFADQQIGANYFTTESLQKIYSRSQKNGLNSSIVVKHNEKIIAIRLSYMPSTWMKDSDLSISPRLWNTNEATVAYFKSLFIHPDYQGQGLGEEISQRVIDIFKQAGATAVVTHSWVESPNNSSVKYLTKLGFEKIVDIPLAWNHIDYECVRCTPRRCDCTAREMILRIGESL